MIVFEILKLSFHFWTRNSIYTFCTLVKLLYQKEVHKFRFDETISFFFPFEKPTRFRYLKLYMRRIIYWTYVSYRYALLGNERKTRIYYCIRKKMLSIMLSVRRMYNFRDFTYSYSTYYRIYNVCPISTAIGAYDFAVSHLVRLLQKNQIANRIGMRFAVSNASICIRNTKDRSKRSLRRSIRLELIILTLTSSHAQLRVKFPVNFSNSKMWYMQHKRNLE